MENFYFTRKGFKEEEHIADYIERLYDWYYNNENTDSTASPAFEGGFEDDTFEEASEILYEEYEAAVWEAIDKGVTFDTDDIYFIRENGLCGYYSEDELLDLDLDKRSAYKIMMLERENGERWGITFLDNGFEYYFDDNTFRKLKPVNCVKWRYEDDIRELDCDNSVNIEAMVKDLRVLADCLDCELSGKECDEECPRGYLLTNGDVLNLYRTLITFLTKLE